MADITPIEANMPHKVSEVVCLRCLTRWISVRPVGTLLKMAPFFWEDDYIASMGTRDGYLYVDGGKIADMLNFKEECTKCFCYLDTDGNAYTRRTWSNHEWVEDTAFKDKVKAACENRTDGYVVFIDIHD